MHITLSMYLPVIITRNVCQNYHIFAKAKFDFCIGKNNSAQAKFDFCLCKNNFAFAEFDFCLG